MAIKNQKSKIKNQKYKLKIPEIRYLYDMKDVLCDKKWAKTASDFEVYYMYRGVKKRGKLRYDITIIPPKMLGKEFVKTKGNCNWKGLSELYGILKGKAIFLMQKVKGEIVEDVYAVKAKKENWVIIPPNYTVVTINPSKKILKTSNWVSEKNKNIYKEVEKMTGACYYYLKAGWLKNKNYKKVPKLRFKQPLKSLPQNLDFLN